MERDFVKTRSKTKLMTDDLKDSVKLKKRKLDNDSQPHVKINFNGTTIMIALCDLDSIVSREVTKYIINNKELGVKIIERAKLLDIKRWRQKIERVENQILELRYVVNNLNEDLKADQSARAIKLTKSLNIGVNITSCNNE